MTIDAIGDRPEAFPRRGTAEDKLRALIHYAVLAPSSHNAQPWLFRIEGDSLDLIADRSRALPVADPHDRELVISCGAALECLAVAARGTGHVLAIEILPDPFDRDWIARARLQEDGAPSEQERRLFEAIPHRRSTRRPFKPRQLPPGLLDDVVAAADEAGAELTVIEDEPGRDAVAALVAEGDRRLFADPAFRAELADWINLRAGAGGDGVSGAALGLPALLAPFIALAVRAFDLGESAAATDEDLAAAAPALAALATAGDGQADWIAAGRAASRVLLTLTGAGATAAFLSQPIEVEELRPRLRATCGLAGSPQLLFRMGYGPGLPPAPRRPVEDVLIDRK